MGNDAAYTNAIVTCVTRDVNDTIGRITITFKSMDVQKPFHLLTLLIYDESGEYAHCERVSATFMAGDVLESSWSLNLR